MLLRTRFLNLSSVGVPTAPSGVICKEDFWDSAYSPSCGVTHYRERVQGQQQREKAPRRVQRGPGARFQSSHAGWDSWQLLRSVRCPGALWGLVMGASAPCTTQTVDPQEKEMFTKSHVVCTALPAM